MTIKKLGVVAAILVLSAGSLAAQGHGPKRYAVSKDRAVVVTREVLGRKGFEVVRVETVGNDQIVWYRAGHRGRRGRGNGPSLRMVIRRDPVANKVVFLQTPSDILVDIDVKLR